MTNFRVDVKGELIELPSQGAVYGDELGTELIQGNSVKIRPFLASDQKALAGNTGDQYKLLYALASRFIVEPTSLKLDKLLISDIQSVLFASRIISFGPEYKFRFKCENCGSSEITELNLLESLEVKYSEEFDSGFNDSDLEFSLSTGVKVKYHLPRLEDSKKVNSYAAQKRKRNSSITDTDKVYYTIASLIDQIGDKNTLTPDQKIEYIENLSLKDFSLFLEEISNNDVGLPNTVNINCKNCGWENEERLSIDANFFRP